MAESRRLKQLEADFPGYRQRDEAFETLTTKQHLVLSNRYAGKTLADIGARYPRADGGVGVTANRIMQIEAQACRKVRRLARSIFRQKHSK